MTRRRRPREHRQGGAQLRHAAAAGLLVIVIPVNLLLMPAMADVVERFGGRPGQIEKLTERMHSVSGSQVIRGTWRLHLQIGELVGSGTLHLPYRHPLDEQLLDHYAGVQWVIEDPVEIPSDAVRPLLDDFHYLMHDANDELYYLIPGSGADRRYVLARIVPGDELRAPWIIGPMSALDVEGAESG